MPSQRSGLSALIWLEGRLESSELRQEAWPQFDPEKWAHVATLYLPSSLTGGGEGWKRLDGTVLSLKKEKKS